MRVSRKTNKRCILFCSDVRRLWNAFPVDCIEVARKVKSQIHNRLREVKDQAQKEYDGLMKQLPSEEELIKIHRALGKSHQALSGLIKEQDSDYIKNLATIYSDVTSSFDSAEKYHRYLRKLV